MIWSEELRFIQDRAQLLTLVSFYYPWDFGRTLLWDQSGTCYSLSKGVGLFESFPTMGRGRGRWWSGRWRKLLWLRQQRLPLCPSSPTAGRLGWIGLFIMWQWPERWQTDLPEISSRAGLELIYGAGLRGRDEKEKCCTLLASTTPSSFNKTATTGSGGIGDWLVTCHTRWSLSGHHWPHVRFQDKFYNGRQRGSRERLYLGREELPALVLKGRESRRLPFSKHPTERSSGQGFCWTCNVGLPSVGGNRAPDTAGEEKDFPQPSSGPWLGLKIKLTRAD